MKYYHLICFLILCIFLLRPIKMSNAQFVGNKGSREKYNLDFLEAKKRMLFEEAFANQDTLKELDNLKPKKVVVKKIEYVKIYKTVPIYVPIEDSIAYKIKFPKDTLENDYLVAGDLPHVSVPPSGNLPVKKKKGFLYRLFHGK